MKFYYPSIENIIISTKLEMNIICVFFQIKSVCQYHHNNEQRSSVDYRVVMEDFGLEEQEVITKKEL